MLTLNGRRQSYCDGVSRRNFLRIGALGVGGTALANFTLADLLRAESTKPDAGKKSIINIYLSGGPSHLDTFDLKPGAPPEIRGEFHPIATAVPGMQICYLMPKLAQLASKLAIVRSLTGIRDEHAPNQTESGWSENDLKSIGGHPSMGSVVSKIQGPSIGTIPRFVDLTGHTRPGFLGPTFSGFRPDGEGRTNLRLRTEISLDRFHNRTELLGKLDRIRRDVDATHAMDAMDAFNQRAASVITSSQLADALDWEKTDEKVRQRYSIAEHQDNSRFLIAKRLDRVRRADRELQLGWLGHAQRKLHPTPPPIAAARYGPQRFDRRPRRDGLVGFDGHRDVGRIRPHAAHQ